MAEKSSIPLRRQGLNRIGSAALALVLLSVPLACVTPPFRGYQIQDPPEGFLYDANSSQAAILFPEREVIAHGAWWRLTTDDRNASIAITRFRGVATVEEVERARDRYAAAVDRSGGGEVTQLQFLRIDGREAWGWEEHRLHNGEPSAVAYRTVVLYDTMAIALEFFSDIPEWMDAPRQEAVLATFALGETRILWGWVIAILVLAGGLFGGFIRHVTKNADKPLTITEYQLPSIPRDEPEPDKPLPPGGGGDEAGGGPHRVDPSSHPPDIGSGAPGGPDSGKPV